jgi:beta,beta-carotene 9',10'-dioxygenase
MTENYFVLMESPYVVDPYEAVRSGRPFVENYRLEPERGSSFIVIRRDGKLVGKYQTDPFFCFHQINAYEQDDELVFDLSVFETAEVVKDFYLEKLRSGQPPSTVPFARRYKIPLAGGEVTYEMLAEQVFELPQINYGGRNGKPYSYAYGVGVAMSETPTGFLDSVVKLDVEGGQHLSWHEPGRFPGEPVFVAHPDGEDEDDGVLLSITLDPEHERSLLLVLDAKDLSELARVAAPHHIPWHFHGQFAGNLT